MSDVGEWLEVADLASGGILELGTLHAGARAADALLVLRLASRAPHPLAVSLVRALT